MITSEPKIQNVAPRHWLELTDMTHQAFKVKVTGGISLLIADLDGAPFAEIIVADPESPHNKIVVCEFVIYKCSSELLLKVYVSICIILLSLQVIIISVHNSLVI